ncbi:regulator of G protein signaling superfamily [Basidiobolus meristosporus CBS 931.73]|uniref:Regulator of G protein signaling superfamily n=1 Tax=Basidiobolus meristosporus CBS 931.73 TaxID=1314790 RepID=A0A1Y1Y0M0_9FUNG|nr:regulator of G protein signaling superfamily [Basidiobolus meristosporus CBS 931.73]|eukprot:ORX91445.1 regulator of G protein signaling superfamily [Basidiobolus meristosporus CBS 931.73]
MLFELFKDFAVQEFSVENPLFFERCQRAKLLTIRHLREEVLAIYETFIVPGAALQVNVGDSVVKQITLRILDEQIDRTIFDEAIVEVTEIMMRHSFPRFLRSRKRQSSKFTRLF